MKPPSPLTEYVFGANNVHVDSALRSGTGYKLEVSTESGGFVDLRAFWFPGWKVKSKAGAPTPIVEPSPIGYVRLRLPARGHYYALVYFGSTPIRTAATIVSLLSLLVLIAGLSRLRRPVAATAPQAAT